MNSFLYFKTEDKSSNQRSVLYEKFIGFYQQKVSTRQGHRCPCLPTCSNYTLFAMDMYGLFWGFIMGVERIYIRENMDMKYRIHYLTIWREGRPKVYDLPEANFIFKKKDWRIVDPFYYSNCWNQ